MIRDFFEGQASKETLEMVDLIPKAYPMVELAGVRKGMVERTERNSKRDLMVELVGWHPKWILDPAARQK
jgi:hypothetical protein